MLKLCSDYSQYSDYLQFIIARVKLVPPDNHFCEEDQDEENQVPGWEIHEKMLDEEESFYLLSDLSIEENLFFVIFELRLILV